MKSKQYFIAAMCCLYGLINTSCGIFHPPERENGYLVSHYYSCGPQALEKALRLYSEKHGIKFKRSYTQKELSIEIQDSIFLDLREFLVLLNKDASQITWPNEIKQTLKVRGIKVVEIKSIEELDKHKDVAIILIHKKGALTSYHWIAYPVDNIQYYYDKTVIDRIFLLKPIH